MRFRFKNQTTVHTLTSSTTKVWEHVRFELEERLLGEDRTSYLVGYRSDDLAQTLDKTTPPLKSSDSLSPNDMFIVKRLPLLYGMTSYVPTSYGFHNLNEEEKLQALQNNQKHPSEQMDISETYRCRHCGVYGEHHVRQCPVKRDRPRFIPLYKRRPAFGWAKSMLRRAVTLDEIDTAFVDNCGHFVVPL